MNQDGVDDLVVGAPNADYRGCVFVYSGKSGEILWRHTMDDAGVSADSVSGAGDVNKDGFDDIIVGGVAVDILNMTPRGVALVISGGDGAILWRFEEAIDSSFSGFPVASAGDVDRDGFPDVITGLPGAGSVSVYSGKDGSVLRRFHSPGLGRSVASAGDVDRDGHDDLIVGGRNPTSQASSAFVYSGKDGSEIWRFDGNPGEGLGTSVAGAGDVNLDGFDDVIVGAPGPDLSKWGYARVYSGRDGALLWHLASPYRHLGKSVAGAGDVDADGFPDLIVGAADRYSRTLGGAMVYSGRNGSVLASIPDDSMRDNLGFSVAGAGDLDQDGFDEVLVGAPQILGGSTANGFAAVYKFRPATIRYGVGLPGSGNITPGIGTGGERAQLGGMGFKIEITEALGGSPCLIAGSFSRAEIPMGAGAIYGDYLTPGEYYLAPVILTSGAYRAPGAGTATLPIGVPYVPSLLGLQTYWQGFVMDSGAPSGISTTGGLEVTVVR